ncbi:unnamed protein product [Peronospora farinosa]|uniref:Elicitin n=1 Tax=Peronospora farinosa TaxID=134698 RepID=A0AAV0UV54_9STRA|nr:unnamed protein product [Peronospora farinosa]CAI5740821.1 unnamed protein product [Peronospora farinosa]
MTILTLFQALLLFVSVLVVKAKNCTVEANNHVLQSIALDLNYTLCRSDSNYTFLSFTSPTTVQTRDFCSSSACQSLLSTTLRSGQIPKCKVIVGTQAFNLTDAVALIAFKCKSAADKGSLTERLVDRSNIDSKTQRASEHVASAIGHSTPMDDVGFIGSLLSLLRK